MKLMIAGSRSITDFDISLYIPKDTDLIISEGTMYTINYANKLNKPIKVVKVNKKRISENKIPPV